MQQTPEISVADPPQSQQRGKGVDQSGLMPAAYSPVLEAWENTTSTGTTKVPRCCGTSSQVLYKSKSLNPPAAAM